MASDREIVRIDRLGIVGLNIHRKNVTDFRNVVIESCIGPHIGGTFTEKNAQAVVRSFEVEHAKYHARNKTDMCELKISLDIPFWLYGEDWISGHKNN